MFSNNFLKITVCVAIPATLLPLLLIYATKKRHKRLMQSLSKPSTNGFYKFIFTTCDKGDCKQHIYKRIACSKDCAYNTLATFVKFFESAKHSISLCMYLLTFSDIQNVLIHAHNHGIKVRFISDNRMLLISSAGRSVLKNAGIPIKMQKTQQTLLHHKFCLIDEDYPEAQMFFGSLNLTLQAVTKNFDFVVFTNDQIMITRYKDHFNNLWDILVDA